MNKRLMSYIILTFSEAMCVFIGIVFPYQVADKNASNNAIYCFQLIFLFSVVAVQCYVYYHKLNYVKFGWLYSFVMFYLSVTVFYVLGEQWGINTKMAFGGFGFEHHDFIFGWDYPIGILGFSIAKLVYQRVIVYSIIKAVHRKIIYKKLSERGKQYADSKSDR